ncbi:hypothetical protein Tco_1447378 [Tanacetum coccineum]
MQKKWMQKESVSKQGRKTVKSKPTAHKDQDFDDLDDFDAIDYMEIEDARNEKGVSTEDQVSTAKPDEGTDKPKVSTNKIDEGTAELKNENSDENATPTVFGDDETIAEFLTSPQSRRSMLTLKPLPKLHLNIKARKSEEEAESKLNHEGAIIGSRYILATRLQEEEREKFTIKERAKLLHDTIDAQRLIKDVNKKATGIKKDDNEDKEGLVIHMLVEKKHPLRRKVPLQMLELKLESEEDSTMALELIRFVKKLIAELEPKDSDGNEKDL